MKLTFSNGTDTKSKEFKKRNPMPFLFFIQKLPEGYKLVEVEGEGELADFFREQIRLRKELGEKYVPDYNQLIHKFVGG